jgi:hypothetical protein
MWETKQTWNSTVTDVRISPYLKQSHWCKPQHAWNFVVTMSGPQQDWNSIATDIWTPACIKLHSHRCHNLMAETSVTDWRTSTCLKLTFIGMNGMQGWRMASSGMLRCVALVRTAVSEELSASFIRVTWIGERGIFLQCASVVSYI